MEILVLKHCYDSYGGHTTLSLVGSFLIMEAPDFGTAVTEIELHPYYRSARPAKKTLEELYLRHHAYLGTLPKSRFLRNKQRITIDFHSEIATAEDISEYGPPQLALFIKFYHEVHKQLMSIKKNLRSSDDFAVDEFLAWIAHKEAGLPKSDSELEQLEQLIKRHEQTKRDAMDDWQKLGVDWIDYHPEARAILDLPFYWECANDFAPNGNDTGADVLRMYADWRKQNRGRSSKAFFDQLLKEWEVSRSPNPGDRFSIQTYDDSVIGLAFARLKLDGRCPAWIRDEALAAIGRQEAIIRAEHSTWSLFGERMKTFGLMRRKLEESPTGPST